MALDPSIILANADPARQFDPVASMGKALQVKSMQAQLAQQQQALQDAADFRTRHGISPGVAQAEQKIQLGNLEQQKAEREAAKAHLEAAESLNNQQDSVYRWGLSAIEKNPAMAPQIHAEVLRKTMENAKLLFPKLDTSKSDDPTSFAVPNHPTESVPGAPPSWDVEAQKAWLQGQIEKIPMTKAKLEQAKLAIEQKKQDWAENQPRSDFGKFAADLGLDPNDPRALAAYQKAHPRGSMATIQLGDVSGTLKDPGEERIAQLVADGKLAAPPMSRNNPRNLRIIARADEISRSKEGGEGLDATQFPTRQAAMKYFTTGKGADAFRQQETILHHAETFKKIADALDNGNVQLANKLGAEVGAKFAGSDKATNLKIAGTIFSAEVGKYLSGSQSTQAERAELTELLPVFSSPEQFKGGLDTLSNLVQGQRKSWERQKQAALRGKPVEDEPKAETPKVTPPKVAPPKPGDVVDGYVFNGGNPADPKNWKKR